MFANRFLYIDYVCWFFSILLAALESIILIPYVYNSIQSDKIRLSQYLVYVVWKVVSCMEYCVCICAFIDVVSFTHAISLSLCA